MSDYLNFLKAYAPPGYSYEARHFELIAARVQEVLDGQHARLRIHMPPRHGKSETVTKGLPLWLLKHRPGSKILITGHNMRFAKRLCRAVRDRAKQMGIEIDPKYASAEEWMTTDGSFVMAAGVGGVPTGEGFDCIIADDPIKDRMQADSSCFRDSLWEWWTEGLMTRLQPNGFVVGIWTLWHEDDIAGRMDELAKQDEDADQFVVLKLAALAGPDDPIGRAEGEPLWPEVWTLRKLKNRRASMTSSSGLRAWEALYQQNPTPREGGFFAISCLSTADAAPKGLKSVRAWDVGASTRGDWTVGVRMDGPDENGVCYVVDVQRFRLLAGARDRRILAASSSDGVGTQVRLPQDPGAAGKAQLVPWQKLLAGFDCRFASVTGDKQVRAGPLSAAVENGRICLIRGSWNAEFIEELRQFPAGRHDDQVDAAADAYSALNRAREIREIF